MNIQLKIGKDIFLNNHKYLIKGVDTYTLTNIFNKKTLFTSYTLVDDQGEKIWLGYKKNSKFLLKQWIIPEKKFRKLIVKAELNIEFTGISNIVFEGNQGYSLPWSEIICFDNKNADHDYLAIERFLENSEDQLKTSKSYFHAIKKINISSILQNYTTPQT